MGPRRFLGIVLLVIIITSAAIYKAATTKQIAPEIKRAQIVYETEKLDLKRRHLERNSDLTFYSVIGVFSTICASLLMLSGGYARAKVKAVSVYMARIGQHSVIPVHYKDLQSFYPIAVNLSLAEIEASVSTSHDQAYRLSRQMVEDITNYTRALAGQRGLIPIKPTSQEQHHVPPPALTTTPSFAELLRHGVVAPGKPLVFGYSQGQPQYRSLQDLKSLAITGWQGSGKTRSTAYLIASSVLAYGIQAYVIDPHKAHHESLYALIQPLEKTEHVKVINPFDTPTLIHNLNAILDRRLAGQEPDTPGILLVIDEMALLAKLDYFDMLVAFLERCTEETRKANITFLGSSHKWTARHFKGRADIRGCMNSMLIHKTKPSQADLLLEDAQDKNLVKQLQRPGDAILITDYDPPTLISIPFCTRQDMETVAKMLGKPNQTAQPELSTMPIAPSMYSKQGKTAANVVFIDPCQQKEVSDPRQLTVEQIRAQLDQRKQQESGLTQAEVARQAGLSPALFSKILNGQRPLTDKQKLKLYDVLFPEKRLHVPQASRLVCKCADEPHAQTRRDAWGT